MKEGAAIRFLLVALPAGLLALGVGAMVATYLKRDERPIDPNEAKRLDAASLMRRPVSAVDLQGAVEMLSLRIGERHGGRPEALEQAVVWIESMLGPANLGYLVERHVFEAEGGEARNLVAELPGRKRRREFIVVGARYDSSPGSEGANANASGVAALLSLARAFAGDPQERALRFVAFAGGEGAGSLAYARRCQARGETIVAMLCLDSLAFAEGEGLVFSGGEDSRYFLDAAKGAFSAAASVPAALGLPDPSGQTFAALSDAGSFLQVGYPGVLATGAATPAAPGFGLSPNDSREVDPARLEEATRGLEAVLRAWANP
jgi:hypothetical protein